MVLQRTNTWLQPFRPVSKPVFLALVFVIIALETGQVAAESAPCRYDPDKCSCTYNPQGGGACWTSKPASPGLCLRRKCRGGWSCQCAGRTHLCHVRKASVYAPVSADEATQLEAPCEKRTRTVVNSTDIELGFVLITISHDGLLDNDCTRFAVYHNGVQLASFPSAPAISVDSVSKEQQDRAFHDKLEMRPGDVLAFRFLQSSYYCFGNSVVISHGAAYYVVAATDGPKFEARYSRAASQGWNTQGFQITPANSHADENGAKQTDWMPLRTKRLSAPHENIVSGIDYWKPRDDSNADNRRGDWYFRMKIPQPHKEEHPFDLP